MCIIDGNVKDVKDTKIIVSKYNNKQLTVYSNTVNIDREPVAMILPVPKNYYNKLNIEVFETNEYDMLIFNELESFKSKNLYTNSSYLSYDANDSIEVLRSGSYRYSIVDNVSNFSKLSSEFNIKDKNLINLLKKYKNFGFIVCIIDKSAKYSPFVYSHDLMDSNKLFVPTKHYHNGKEKADDWNHSIYGFGTIYGNSWKDWNFANQTSNNISKLLPVFCSKKNITTKEIKGFYSNIDITFECEPVKNIYREYCTIM